MPKPKTAQAEYDEPESGQGAEGGSDLDPVIEALLEHLPAPGESFPGRKLWMQILELVLQLVYPEEQPGGAQPT